MASLRQLRYFLAVAHEGQLTRAAGRLHLAQPALSRSIAQLEASLGFTLFERHARGIRLTPAGEAYLEKAERVVAAADDAEAAARGLAANPVARMLWGFNAIPPIIEMALLVGAFTSSHPNLVLSYRDLGNPRTSTVAWLHEADIGLLWNPTPHPDVEILPLSVQPRVLLVPGSHPFAGREELDPHEALEETFCGRSPGLDPIREAYMNLNDYRGGPPANVTGDESDSQLERISQVAAGKAVMVARPALARLAVEVIPGIASVSLADARPAPLALVWRRDSRHAEVEDLVRLARSEANGAGASPVAADGV